MSVPEFAFDGAVARLARWIERDEDVLAPVETLQRVHPVGDGQFVARARRAFVEIIPARPGGPALRHQGNVLVKHGTVVGIIECAEQFLFERIGIGEKLERDVGMGGQNDIVENRGGSVLTGHKHLPVLAHDTRRGTARAGYVTRHRRAMHRHRIGIHHQPCASASGGRS